jgi:hypothetical protein
LIERSGDDGQKNDIGSRDRPALAGQDTAERGEPSQVA